MSNEIIYIPTMTSKLRYNNDIPENILYSPNINITNKFKAQRITIWDNYTYYWRNKYNKLDKWLKARNHYLWLINYIKENYEEGITLITPDVDWLVDGEYIEKEWNKYCKHYPQLYVPNTWKTSNKDLNIIGYALRPNSTKTHKNWNHCLRHKRDIDCNLLTYDAINPLNF